MPTITERAQKKSPALRKDEPSESAADLNNRLLAALRTYDGLSIAVSGGIDSMTLAYIAHRFSSKSVNMVHALSPAVPVEATMRIKEYAAREGWNLSLVDAGEFSDPSYRANPVNRCYFCKSNLYDRIGGLSSGVIASGTNVDDLGDFRPGLKAAAERNVVHPFVEARISKNGIRELARMHGLTDIAELPAQPCLSSRVETGIHIDADDLAFIDAAERHLRAHAPAGANVRCRLTRNGIVLEAGGASDLNLDHLAQLAGVFCKEAGRDFAGARPYRQGSAFLQKAGQSDDAVARN